MEETGVKRKLAVILAADVAGYSRLMGADEEATLKTLGAYREIIDGTIAGHEGRIFATAGDSVVAEFASPVEAVRAAISIQEELAVRNAGLADERKMHFRIGINLGDVMVQRDNLLGDGVNIAARLEGLADPGGICVSDMVYQSVEAKLDLAFEDLGAQTVKNIAKPVRAYRVVPASAASTASSREPPRSQFLPRLGVLAFAAIVVAVLGITGAAIWKYSPRPAPDLPRKPSVAVLPFDNMSGDPEQEYFSDGITEDIITDLAKISGLFVVSRKAAFRYKGKDVGPAKVSRDLGVRYVLEGSVRRAGGKVRINAQLIDATTGGHLWAERYDRDLKDIFALQDEITEKIVAALEVRLTRSEQDQVARRYTDNLEAYEYFLRGKVYQRRFTNEGNFQARRMYKKAIELDPKFAAAYAEMSWTYFFEWREFSSFSGDSEGALDRGLEVAKKAVALDDSLPLAHTRLGWIYRWKSKNEKAIAEFERAIDLDPNFAEAYSDLSSILFKVGKPEEAISKAKTAIRLDPHAPARFYHLLGNAYFWADSMRGTERYRKEAIAAFKKALALDPDFAPSRRKLAAIYAEMGRMAKAETEITEILRVSPGASLERMRRIWVVGENHPDYDRGYERWLEAMRKAGLPETSKAAAP